MKFSIRRKESKTNLAESRLEVLAKVICDLKDGPPNTGSVSDDSNGSIKESVPVLSEEELFCQGASTLMYVDVFENLCECSTNIQSVARHRMQDLTLAHFPVWI